MRGLLNRFPGLLAPKKGAEGMLAGMQGVLPSKAAMGGIAGAAGATQLKAEEKEPRRFNLPNAEMQRLISSSVTAPQGGVTGQQDFFGGLLSGIGSFAKQNPALFRGLLTAGIGMASGQQPLSYLGMGGMALSQEQAEQQRQQEEANKLNMQLLGQLKGGTDKPISEYYSAARSMLGPKATPEQINQTAAALKAQDLGATIGYENQGGILGFKSRQVPVIEY